MSDYVTYVQNTSSKCSQMCEISLLHNRKLWLKVMVSFFLGHPVLYLYATFHLPTSCFLKKEIPTYADKTQ